VLNKKINIALFVLILICNAGCVSTSVTALKKDISTENSGIVLDVPFVKQEKNYCGPAALESVFKYWGRQYGQNEIAKEIFAPELCATLNVDLERYAKDKGFWAKGYQGDFKTLKTRVLAGIPVIVIEKLHPFALNRYHYVVIIGFNEKRKSIIEHTGTKEYVVRSYRGFKRNWYAANSWMLEIMPAEQVKAELVAEDDVELGVILEKKGKFDVSLKHYYDALAENADSPIALFNVGNVYTQLKLWDDAEGAYRKAIKLKKDFPDCYNNLAYVFLKKGEYAKAHVFVDKALVIAGKKRLYYLDTKAQIFFEESKFDPAIDYFNKAQAELHTVDEPLKRAFYQFWNEKFRMIGRQDLIVN